MTLSGTWGGWMSQIILSLGDYDADGSTKGAPRTLTLALPRLTAARSCLLFQRAHSEMKLFTHAMSRHYIG